MVYADGEKRYILHPKGLNQGDTVVSGPGSDTRTGNALPLGEIPLGTTVHNIELKIGKGGQLCRTAGSSAQVVAKEGEYVTLRLRSTEMRLIHGRCLATVGEVGNAEHELLSVGKAGKSRWLGKRPKVRGVAMNPVDHPLGGGEGQLTSLRLRSTEMRLIHGRCFATVGEVGNAEHELLSVGKAGKSRWLGKRPKVRGVAMNPVDHPLGGGEGKSSGGRPPVSPWGKPEGRKTRHRKKASTKLIVRGRKRGKATR